MPGSPLLNLSEISVTLRDSEIFSIKSTTYTPSPHILHAPHAPIEIERRQTMTATPIPAIHARAAGPQRTLPLPKTCFSQTNPAHLSQNTTHHPRPTPGFPGYFYPFRRVSPPVSPAFPAPHPAPFQPLPQPANYNRTICKTRVQAAPPACPPPPPGKEGLPS